MSNPLGSTKTTPKSTEAKKKKKITQENFSQISPHTSLQYFTMLPVYYGKISSPGPLNLRPYIKQHLPCLELWGAPSNALISGDCPERARPGPAAEGGGLMLQRFLEIWSLILVM